MSAMRFAAAVALVTIAAIAALLAADVRSWPVALERGDATSLMTPRRAQWTPETHLGNLAEKLLGTADEVAARTALRRYREVVGIREHADDALNDQTVREQAINALAGPASSTDPRLAAQARTLLGILVFGEAAEGGGVSQTNSAIADFTDAVRADPDNTAAKFDLELLLRLSAAHGHRRQAGPVNAFGKTGHAGSSGGSPGSGY